MRFFLILIILIVLIVGCVTTPLVADSECIKESDCVRAGCSSQLCMSKENIEEGGGFSTCEFTKEYGCLQEFATCGCNNGKCDFTHNDGFEECMNEY